MRLLSLLLPVLITGCLHTNPPRAPRAPDLRTDPFSPTKKTARASLEEEPSESQSFTTYTLRFDAEDQTDEKNLEVVAKLRVPARSSGLIIVLPILGGDYGPSDTFAIDLAESGFVTIRFDRKKDLFDPEGDFERVAKRTRQGVVDVRRGITWAISRGYAQRGGIGILGISMGSFAGALVTATDDRVDASVLALGGGEIGKVVTGSAQDEEEIDRFLQALRQRGYNRDRMVREAKRALSPLDPLRYAHQINPQTSLFVQARFDGVVPFEEGSKLWEASQRPERIVVLTGHYSAVFALPFILRATRAHFEKHLSGKIRRRRSRPSSGRLRRPGS